MPLTLTTLSFFSCFFYLLVRIRSRIRFCFSTKRIQGSRSGAVQKKRIRKTLVQIEGSGNFEIIFKKYRVSFIRAQRVWHYDLINVSICIVFKNTRFYHLCRWYLKRSIKFFVIFGFNGYSQKPEAKGKENKGFESPLNAVRLE